MAKELTQFIRKESCKLNTVYQFKGIPHSFQHNILIRKQEQHYWSTRLRIRQAIGCLINNFRNENLGSCDMSHDLY